MSDPTEQKGHPDEAPPTDVASEPSTGSEDRADAPRPGGATPNVSTSDPLRLVYVADPMCSWCWGFAPVLEELRTTFDLPVQVVVGGLRPGPSAQPLDSSLAAYLRGTWTRIAEMTGQPFDFTPLDWEGWVYDTEMPARAVVAARTTSPALALPAFTRLQRAFYAEAVDVTDPENAALLMADVGLEPGPFLDRLRSDEVRAATWNDFRLAREMGISGFPALLVAGSGEARVLTLGYRPASQLTRALDGIGRDFDAP